MATTIRELNRRDWRDVVLCTLHVTSQIDVTLATIPFWEICFGMALIGKPQPASELELLPARHIVWPCVRSNKGSSIYLQLEFEGVTSLAEFIDLNSASDAT